MVITCPNCGSTFNLPEDRAAPEAQARCSVCRHIFRLGEGMPGASGNRFLSGQAVGPAAEESAPSGGYEEEAYYIPRSAPQKAAKGKKAKLFVILALIVIVAGGFGGYVFFRHSGTDSGEAVTGEEKARLVREISINRRRQYLQENQYLGKIVVIDGIVVNNGDKPKDFIMLEAALINPQGIVLTSKQFFCGPELKQSQLKTMGEVEMEKWLTNQTEIFRLNTGLNKGDEAPFMVVFYRPPAELLESAEGYSYRLTVIDARNAKTGAE